MDIIDEIYRVKKLHQLISVGNTGTPEEFASKVLSRRQLYNMLDWLKNSWSENRI